MLAGWEPDLYRRFEAERTRPARDLLARVKEGCPVGDAVDLGCGPGNSTELLVQRFPNARIVGVDTSGAMLAAARQRLPEVSFVEGDIATWTPSARPDLIFANAALQWVPNHATLVPRLFASLRANGVLAMQVPDNVDELSHRLMREVAGAGPWKDRIEGAGSERAKAVLPPASYYDLLAPWAAEVDVWRTTYYHRMPSAAAIVDWLKSTGLRTFLDPLREPERVDYLQRYEDALAQAYPCRADGQRLLAFPRLFIVARAPN